MHTSNDRVVIRSSKTKLTLLTVGALLFVVGGIWLFDIADNQTRFAWYWSLLAIFLAGGLERPLLAFLCRRDLEAALKFRQEHKELFDELHRLEGSDPLEDALD